MCGNGSVPLNHSTDLTAKEMGGGGGGVRASTLKNKMSAINYQPN